MSGCQPLAIRQTSVGKTWSGQSRKVISTRRLISAESEAPETRGQPIPMIEDGSIRGRTALATLGDGIRSDADI
jgi:hypothetical protein